MFEKVNPAHPDKIADRIAGALVDYAYSKEENPKIAVEVLIGHGVCTIIAESSVDIPPEVAHKIVLRIAGNKMWTRFDCHPQDPYLAENQFGQIRCGDNGIFKGVPVTKEQRRLSFIARHIYNDYGTDGKYILDSNERFIVCQSNAPYGILKSKLEEAWGKVELNPLGDWTGGTDVDTGATNRKLGSDMGDSVTGGGLHGKDLSKADVSVNIYAWLNAQRTGEVVELCCAIGDKEVDGRPYSEIVEIARKYIMRIGGFEKFAEWGLI